MGGRRALVAGIISFVATSAVLGPPSPVPRVEAAPSGFVTSDGDGLVLDGAPYRFTGINIYNANNTGGCWNPMSDATLGASLDTIGNGRVIRAWFFQSLATNGGTRDWTSFDRTLAFAASRGIKVIPTLGNQWGACDGANGGPGLDKDEAWYSGGYATSTQPGSMVAYRDWVAEVVTRYATDSTVLAWQLMNEAEVKPVVGDGLPCSTGAANILRDFAIDVSGLVKTIDPNHLVSLGTIGGGQCGTSFEEYAFVHDVPTIDVCEYHDYGAPNQSFPGDEFNGLTKRVAQCDALNKPLIIGESGIRPTAAGGSFVDRADAFRTKLGDQLAAGIDGAVLWAWNPAGSTLDDYDIGPGDPVLSVLSSVLVPPPAASGYLDPTFGGDGFVQRPTPAVDTPDDVRVADVAYMDDGRIVVGGDYGANPCDLKQWWVGRFMPDGTPDPTFGGGTGSVHFVPPGYSLCLTPTAEPLLMNAIAIQSTGKIVIGGHPDFVLIRLNPDGTLDSTFAAPGEQIPPVASQCLLDNVRSGGTVWDLAVDPNDDSIVAAGSVARRSNPAAGCSGGRYAQGAAVFRVTSTGSTTELDAPWGTSTTPRYAVRVSLLSDGTPVVAAATGVYWLGSIQSSVTDVYTAISGPENDVVGLVVDSLDRVTLAALADDYYTVELDRFDATAAPDGSFGTGGEVFESSLGRVASIALDSADRLVVTGFSESYDGGIQIGRFDTVGVLDPTFGSGGVRADVPMDAGNPVSFVNAVAVHVGAGDQPAVVARGDATLVFGRYLIDGTPDTSLDGEDGFMVTPVTVTIPLEAQSDLLDLEVSPTGETFAVVGLDILKWRSDGILDPAFGVNGRLAPPPGRGAFDDLVLDHSGHLVAMGDRINPAWIGRFDSTTGAVDSTFGETGFTTFTNRLLTSLAVDSADRVVAAGFDLNPTVAKVFRLGTDGLPDPTFADGGDVTPPMLPLAMTVDSSDRVAVTSSNPIDVVRYSADGTIDGAFARTTVSGVVSRLVSDASGALTTISSGGGTKTAIRILPTGGLDTAFANNGALDTTAFQRPVNGTLDDLGRLIISGQQNNTNDLLVLRYTATGTLDTTFATDGRARVRLPVLAGEQLPTSSSQNIRARVDGSGRIVLGVRTARPTSFRTGQVTNLVRFVPNPPADTAGPVITVAAPAEGSTYLSTDSLIVDFACADVGSSVDQCTGDPPLGFALDMWPGPRTFQAYATDLAGNSTTQTVHFTVLDAVSQNVSAGSTVGTGTDTHVNDPLDTQIYTPNAGTVSILEQPITGSPAGYELVGWEAVITAPPATAADPLRFTFQLDQTALGAFDATTVQIFRGGAPVAGCVNAADGTANPDPCVAERSTLPDGDARFRVFTSAASTWTFGRQTDAVPPAIIIDSPSDGAAFTLGQVVAATYGCTDSGGSGLTSCDGTVASGGAVDTTTAGTFPFTVNASDGAGNPASATSTYEVLAGNVAANVTGAAIVTTDPGGLGASSAIPIQTQLDVPNGVAGQVNVTPQAAGAPPTGYALFGAQVTVTGPQATGPSLPYADRFTIDTSQLGAISPAQIEVFRDGVRVVACTSATDAVPDPCVADRSSAAGGDAAITVRTTRQGTWSFGRPTFIAISATPSSRAQGTSAQAVVVTGDGFQSGSTVRVSGSGVTVNTTTRVSATTLELTLTVGGSAAIGPRDITVTNPGAVTAVCRGCFTVNVRPTITSLSPTGLPRGASNAIVRVNGSGFRPGATAAFVGTGVAVNSVTVLNAGQLDLSISIDVAAATGTRALTLTNPDAGVATKSGALTVNALPTITSTTPNRLRQNQAVAVVIIGSGFPANFVTGGGSVTFGDGITVQSVVRNSMSKLTVNVAISASAVPGPRPISIINPDGGATTCVGCTAVVIDPQIGSVTPNALARGAGGQNVVITGSGFEPGAVVKFSGSGVTILSTTVTDANTVTLQVSIGGSAALGARNLTVTNTNTGTVTCNACFTVNVKPTIGTVTPNSRPRGSSNQTVQVSGAGFQSGASVTISGTGVTVNVVSVTPTLLTLDVSVASNAATGSSSLTVTNPDFGTATKANAFRVT